MISFSLSCLRAFRVRARPFIFPFNFILSFRTFIFISINSFPLFHITEASCKAVVLW